MKAAEFIARRLSVWGIDTCFTVTGGGAMHLNDAFGAEPGIAVHYHHHEQACSMAAEGYARIAGRPAAVNVTAGPGGINALNGVFGAYTDSLPMVVVAGQVRRDTITTLASVPGLRQLGDQEARMIEMVRPITKWARLVDDPNQLPALVDQAVLQATTGRPGPVWLDVPVDVQGADIPGADPEAPLPTATSVETIPSDAIDQVLDRVEAAVRPVLLVGTGMRIAGVGHLVEGLAEALGIPVVTAWTHDTIATDHPHYAGRPGTIGTRAGNFVVQSCDLLIVLGSRLNIRQVSYNWGAFAADAQLIWVDIDEAELRKPYVAADLPVVADLGGFAPALLEAAAARGLPLGRSGSRGAAISGIASSRAMATTPCALGHQPLSPRGGVVGVSLRRSHRRVWRCDRLHRPLPAVGPAGDHAVVQQQRVRLDGLRPPRCAGRGGGRPRSAGYLPGRRRLADDEYPGAADARCLVVGSPGLGPGQRWLPVHQADPAQLLRPRVRRLAGVRRQLPGLSQARGGLWPSGDRPGPGRGLAGPIGQCRRPGPARGFAWPGSTASRSSSHG